MASKSFILHWIPRGICILAILFVSMFALDAFEGGKPLGDQLLDFSMHLIPSYILIGILLLAWKWELPGGILLTTIGVGLAPIIFVHNYGMNNSILMSLGVIAMVNLPFIVSGVLFIMNSQHKKNK